MVRKRRGITFEPVAGDTLKRLHQYKTAPIDALPTPFPGWNAICGEEGGEVGIAKTWMVVIGGVTGTGKSFVAANIAAHSVRLGRRVGLVNFEMTQSAVATRYLAILAGIPKSQLDMGRRFRSEQWHKAAAVADQIRRDTGGVLVTNESSVFSLTDIEASYEQLAEAGVEQIIVDYAQLVTVEGVAGIFQRSEQVATRLRELTHEYKVQTIALSQFNREEAKAGKPPSIHGLMGGGIWEHAANQIALIDHTTRMKFGRNEQGAPQGEYTQLLFRKNRHGLAPVDMPVKWHYETMRWDEYVPGTDRGDPFSDAGDDTFMPPALPVDPKLEQDFRDLEAKQDPEFPMRSGKKLPPTTVDMFDDAEAL